MSLWRCIWSASTPRGSRALGQSIFVMVCEHLTVPSLNNALSSLCWSRGLVSRKGLLSVSSVSVSSSIATGGLV